MEILKIRGGWDTEQTIEIKKGFCDNCNPVPLKMKDGDSFLDYHKKYDELVEKQGIFVLEIDTAGGEYGVIKICKECIDKAFNQYEQSNNALKQTEKLQDSPSAA